MQAAHFLDASIEAVLAVLISKRLVDDERFTENFIRTRRAKGYGPQRILIELRTRGISEALIAEQLQITDNAWLLAARAIWQKHFRGQKAEDTKNRVKHWRFLQYRGFTQQQINSVIPKHNDHDHDE